MPIDYQIDHTRRLVVAKGRGVFGDEDVFSYQHASSTKKVQVCRTMREACAFLAVNGEISDNVES